MLLTAATISSSAQLAVQLVVELTICCPLFVRRLYSWGDQFLHYAPLNSFRPPRDTKAPKWNCRKCCDFYLKSKVFEHSELLHDFGSHPVRSRHVVTGLSSQRHTDTHSGSYENHKKDSCLWGNSFLDSTSSAVPHFHSLCNHLSHCCRIFRGCVTKLSLIPYYLILCTILCVFDS